MRDDILEAIESAVDSTIGNARRDNRRPPRLSVDSLRWLMRNVLLDLPDDMSVLELREELDIAADQGARHA